MSGKETPQTVPTYLSTERPLAIDTHSRPKTEQPKEGHSNHRHSHSHNHNHNHNHDHIHDRQPQGIRKKASTDLSNSGSSNSSFLESLSGDPGKTPFGFPIGDQSAAAFLANCYERLMKDTTSNHSAGHTKPPSLSDISSSRNATAVLGKMLSAVHSIDEPLTYVFIFTNPRSGNQQGRALMNMPFRNFRMRDRPDVQVQIYDVTDKESKREGLHYLHQLQLRQGDKLLRTAFPELFEEGPDKVCLRPSPNLCTGKSCNGKSCPNGAPSSPMSPSAESTNNSAWEDWISEAAAQLEGGLERFSEQELTDRLERAQESAIKLHVWSAGGDGTVSSTLQAMMDYGIDVGRVYFSCVPFGTGNDFADALGWGRSVPGDAVGESMKHLTKIITERLEGYTSKLDIYEITFTTYDDGHIKHVEKDMFSKPGMKRYQCLMIDYFSLGVQGFVGSSFELHRPGKRALNILMYTAAAAKWVFMKKFPPINEALESISTVPDSMLNDNRMTDSERASWLENASETERKQVLLARVAGPHKRCHGRKMGWTKAPKARRTATARDFGEGIDENLPVIQYKPIEIDVQNVARFWGRDIDVWNKPRENDNKHILSNTNGVTDPNNWTPQYAGDGKVELFGVRDIGDYALNQLPNRKSYRIDRLAQMVTPLALHFRAPSDYPPRSNNPISSRKSIEQGLLFSMCDGEFIEMYHPKDIIISRKVTLKAVGRSPESSRIVLDTIKNDGLDAVQMDATAAANKMRSGHVPDVSNYVASPFQRIFRLGRRSGDVSNGDLNVPSVASGSVLEPRSPNADELSHVNHAQSLPGSIRRQTFNAIRNTLFRGSRNPTDISRTTSMATSSSDIVAASASEDGLQRANTVAAGSHSQPKKDNHNKPPRITQGSKATIHESPLKHPNPMSELRISDENQVEMAQPTDEEQLQKPIKHDPVPVPDPGPDSDSDSGSESDTSESITTADVSSTVGKDNSLTGIDSSMTTPIDADDKHRHNHCLLTIGKDLVSTIEKTSSLPGQPQSPEQHTHCTTATIIGGN
ncbi:hypothetical protein LPJ64_002764 [Coemansia asiatica]|uniref:DAGKc domain-containing protein n=1 Tax=Coemansia asiatica TaxID=1052880 RepID=A0A9W7XN16_9FUNG|nr:hypothetical protein LPJ64_002764 [Coemansia asiatica]